MEPEVHLIEKYLQAIKKWLTMTNIRLKGNKEIDLLAINPRNGEKFHVESRVTLTGFKLTRKDTYSQKGKSKGKPHRRGLDFFDKEKFNHDVVKASIHEIFGNTNYSKILVVWDVEDESVIDIAKERFGIEIWYMQNILDELREAIFQGKLKGSRDDILRTVELVLKMHKVSERKSIGRKIETYDRRYTTTIR